jgi:sialidase-1
MSSKKIDSENKLGRRDFFVLSGGLTAVAAGALNFVSPTSAHASVPVDGLMERFTLDLGHRASRGGPVAALKDGSLIWITTEPEAPYLAKSMWSISRLAMRRSTDRGRSWSMPTVLQQGTKEYSLLSHTVRQSASGAVLHIFVRYSGYDYETGTPEKSLCEVFIQRSNDNGRTWSEAKKLVTGERYHGDILSMEQLRDGRLVYPFCFLTNVKSQFAVSAMYSDDDGKTWKRSPSVLRTGGAGFESGASEPTLIELPDGKLWMLIRAQTGFLWESFSTDRGQTWTPAAPSILPSSNAPATALRLKNGDIAVAWNNHVDSNYARQSLVIGLTRDGKTFKGLREIDFTDFTDDPAASVPHVTYSYLTETREGNLAVSYNKGNWSRHNRPTLARINKDWILAKQDIADFQDGRTGWHTIDPGPKLAAAVERYVLPDDKLWLEIEAHARNKETTGIIRNIPMVADGEIQLTVQATKPEAFILFGNSLLSPRNANEGCLRIRLAGDKIYLAAGKAETTQNNRRTTEYHFLSHRIKDEVSYPNALKANEVLNISVRYQASTSKAAISINGGAPVELTTGKILGLTFVGLLVANGGQIRVQSMKTILK